MLSMRSGILAEAISIASTCLQQRQSTSLTLFLQFSHSHQSKFPVLILYVINWHYSVNAFSFFLWWRMVEQRISLSHVFSSESLSSVKYKWYHIFSISSTGSKFNETWKRIMFIICVIDLSTKNKMQRWGLIKKYRWFRIEKKFFFSVHFRNS